MSMKILISQSIHRDGIKLLADNGYEPVIAAQTDEEYLVSVVEDFDAVIMRGMVKLTDKIIKAAGRCKVIGRHGVGLETIDVKAASEAKIPVVYTPGANANAVAEHTICLILALTKQLCILNARLKLQGDYACRMNVTGTEVKDKIIGLIGLGNIGCRVAEICSKGLGMKVLGYDPYVTEAVLEGKGLAVELRQSVEEILVNADFISLHLPPAGSAGPLIGERELSLMKKQACLINTARGPLVDETALVKALQNGQIAGAGLDVFAIEPPSPDNPLFSLDNVVVTPHSAALTEEGNRNMAVWVAEKVTAVLNGTKPNGLANPEIWEERRR